MRKQSNTSLIKKKSRLKRKLQTENVSSGCKKNAKDNADEQEGKPLDADAFAELGERGQKVDKVKGSPYGQQSKATARLETLPVKLKEKIENLILELNDCGYESLLVVFTVKMGVVSQHGSAQGRKFLENTPYVCNDLCKFYTDKEDGLKMDTLALLTEKGSDVFVSMADNVPIPTEELSDNYEAGLEEEVCEDIVTRNDKVDSPSCNKQVPGKRQKQINSLDFLKSDPNVALHGKLQQTRVEMELVNGRLGTEGDVEFNNMAKFVIKCIENIEDIKANLKCEASGVYKCLFCGLEVQKETKMIGHIDAHVKLFNAPLETCDKCDIRLPEGFGYLHREMHDYSVRPLPREIQRVQRDIRNDVAYFLSQRLGKSKRAFKCRYCSNEFSRLFSIKKHFMRQHTTTYICKECGFSSCGLPEVCTHLKVHRQKSSEKEKELYVDIGDSGISCPYCHQGFSSQTALTHHLDREHFDADLLNFPCTKCKKSFISSTTLKYHLQTHDKVYACRQQDCGKVFQSNRELLAHDQIHSKTEKKTCLCNYCGQVFSAKHRLLEHIEFVHSGRKPLECDVCSAQFRTVEAFRRHKKTHEENSNYVCEHCGEKLKTSQHLWHHKKKHMQKTRHTCFTCQMAFTKKDSLEIHLVNHRHFSEEQPESLIKYQICAHCGKRLTNQHQLRRHIDSNHSEPKKCTYCDKVFKDKSNLRIHLQTHTNSKPRCMVCNLVFRSLFKVNEHMRDAHPDMTGLIEESIKREIARPVKISSEGNTSTFSSIPVVVTASNEAEMSNIMKIVKTEEELESFVAGSKLAAENENFPEMDVHVALNLQC